MELFIEFNNFLEVNQERVLSGKRKKVVHLNQWTLLEILERAFNNVIPVNA